MGLFKPSILLSALTLAGCGSSDTPQSNLSVDITDAPATGVTAVNIYITSVELKQNSDTFTFEINDTIDLLTLQGSESAPLISDVSLPEGQYQYIRLALDLDQSNVHVGDAIHALNIPSANQSGLKLNSPFILSANGNANFTLDFDVAKSLSLNSQGYQMRPTIRIVDNSVVSHIRGTVAAEIITSCNPASVYVFDDDEDFSDMSDTSGPITSAIVSYNDETDNYKYEIGFLESSAYNLFLVCGEDDPTVADEAGVTTYSNNTITLEPNLTATLDFEISNP